jgi:uncharacterized protein
LQTTAVAGLWLWSVPCSAAQIEAIRIHGDLFSVALAHAVIVCLQQLIWLRPGPAVLLDLQPQQTMTIAWHAFTPWTALAGGALIGLAAALFVLLNGRIAGISGVVGGFFKPVHGDLAWRAAFVLGLVGAPWVYALFAAAPRSRIDAPWGALVLAGLLVGVGTRYGAGCTSGHGVCGLARLSPRSLVATLAFMGAGFATVYVTRHVLGN